MKMLSLRMRLITTSLLDILLSDINPGLSLQDNVMYHSHDNNNNNDNMMMIIIIIMIMITINI